MLTSRSARPRSRAAELPFPAPDARATALAALETFFTTVFPSLLRRLAAWKGLRAHDQPDLVDDLRQELALDCIAHASAIVAMPARERHARWFRIAQRVHYGLQVRDGRRRDSDACVADLPSRARDDRPRTEGHDLDLAIERARTALGASDLELVLRIRDAGERFKNGRVNAGATAVRIASSPRAVRGIWHRAASTLGFDDDYRRFWRTRLVEALLALGYVLLRDARALRLWRDEPGAPSRQPRRDRRTPGDCLRRIDRIRAALQACPAERSLRAVLSRDARRTLNATTTDARVAFAHAARVAPDDPAVALWSFEAAVWCDEFGAASRSLRRARACGADPVAVTLGRARLLEARGRLHRAARVLETAVERRATRGDRADRRLGAALVALTTPRESPALEPRALSRRCAPSTTSRRRRPGCGASLDRAS